MPSLDCRPKAAGSDLTSGAVTILDGTSSVDVLHGLGGIPTTVLATPRGIETVAVTSRAAATFTLSRAGTTGDLTVDWAALNPLAFDENAPATISGLVLWLDASSIEGLADGAAVTTWADKSGKGYDATAGTSSPNYRLNGVNGQPAVDFDGGADDMTISMVETTSNWTWFFVIDADADTSSSLSYLYDAATGRFIMSHRSTTGTGNPGYHDGTGHSSAEASITGAQVYEYNLSSAAGGFIYRNGVQILSSTYTQKALGGAQRIAAHNSGGGTNSFDGRIAEIIAYNSALGSTDRDTIYDYIANKYGL